MGDAPYLPYATSHAQPPSSAHATIEDTLTGALFAKLVLLSEHDFDGAPVIARKETENPSTLHSLLNEVLPVQLRTSQDRFWSQWRPRINGVQHRVWMNVRLAQTEEEWAAVRAVLCSFAAQLHPVTTPDAVLQALQRYAQQMIVWWKGRNNVTKRIAGTKRSSGDRHSDEATSGDITSATTDDADDNQPMKKKAELQWSKPLPDDNISLWGPNNSLPMSTDSGLRFLPSILSEQPPTVPYSVPSHALPTVPPTRGAAASGATPVQPLWWNEGMPASEGVLGGADQLLAANLGKVVLLNVGGTQFVTTVRTLMAVPGCFFTKMLARFANDIKTQLFEYVLAYLRHVGLDASSTLRFSKHLPEDKPLMHMLMAEAHFFELPDFAAQIVQALLRTPELEVMQYTSVFSETGFHDTSADTLLQQKQEATLAAFNSALSMQQRAGWAVYSVKPAVFVQDRADGASMRNLVYHALLRRSVDSAARGW